MKHKCDLHIHSNFSDGKFSVSEIVDLYGQNGYSIISITDHLCEDTNLFGTASHKLGLTLNKNNFSLYMETLSYEAERAKKQYNMLLLPGYEITKNSIANHRSAHFLIIGMSHYLCPNQPVDEILFQAKAHQALTIAAHPFHTGHFEFQSYYLWNRRHELSETLIDGWEFNFRVKTIAHVLNSGLPVVANSDLHNKNHFHSWRSLLEGEQSLSNLTQSIRSKKLHFFRENLNSNLTNFPQI